MMLLLSECYRGKITNNEFFLITGLNWSDSICYTKARKLQKICSSNERLGIQQGHTALVNSLKKCFWPRKKRSL